MAGPVQDHVLKLEKENVLPCALSTAMTLLQCDKNGHWVQQGWRYSNQSDSLLAYSKELRHEAAEQIAWARHIPNFRLCFKNWSSNEQNTVHRYHGTPSARLGGWGYGGGQVLWKTQALPLCLAQLPTKHWLSGAPSAYWVKRGTSPSGCWHNRQHGSPTNYFNQEHQPRWLSLGDSDLESTKACTAD